MNLDKAIERSHISLDEDEKQRIQDELDDVLTKLDELKAFKPSRDTTKRPVTLRDDDAKHTAYTTTSEHTDGDNIKSPKP